LKDTEKNLSSNQTTNLSNYKRNMKSIGVLKMNNVSQHYDNRKDQIESDKLQNDLVYKKELLSNNEKHNEVLLKNRDEIANSINDFNKQYQNMKSERYDQKKRTD